MRTKAGHGLNGGGKGGFKRFRLGLLWGGGASCFGNGATEVSQTKRRRREGAGEIRLGDWDHLIASQAKIGDSTGEEGRKNRYSENSAEKGRDRATKSALCANPENS